MDKTDELASGKLEVELFKMYLETAEATSDRRARLNSWMLSINSFVAGLYGFLQAGREAVRSDLEQSIWLGAIPISGVLICLVWWHSIVSYKKLNQAKFTVIKNFEASYSLSFFAAEEEIYEKLGRVSFSAVEQFVPTAFGFIYSCFLAAILLEKF